MIDNIDPIPFAILIAVFSIVLSITTIRDNRRERAERRAKWVESMRADRLRRNLCPRLVHSTGGEWVVCSRPNEHTGPHMNEWTGDLER